MNQDHANAVIRRFDDVAKIVARSVAVTFSFVTEQDDAEQDARLLVLSYAGFVPGGRLAGKLIDWEQLAQGDDYQVTRLLASQLKLDLSQQYGREAAKRDRMLSLDNIPESHHPSTTFEEAMLSHLDIDQTRLDFPYLTAHYIDGLPVAAIADAEGVHRNTIGNRLTKERDVFLTGYLTR